METEEKDKEILNANLDTGTDKVSDTGLKNDENKNEPEKKESSFKENIIPICSAFIALLSLVFTIWQAHKIRVHNEKSVTPKNQFEWHDYTVGTKAFQIKIRNKGIGPAVIDDIIYINKNKIRYSIKELTDGSFWIKILEKEKIPDSIVKNNFEYFIQSPGTFISSNEQIDLLTIKAGSLSNDEYYQIRSFLSGSSFYVDYHSVYDEYFKDSLIFK